MAGKRYNDAAKRYDRERMHQPDEAIELVKSLSTAKFDETVELIVRLGIDPRKTEESVRGKAGAGALRHRRAVRAGTRHRRDRSTAAVRFGDQSHRPIASFCASIEG